MHKFISALVGLGLLFGAMAPSVATADTLSDNLVKIQELTNQIKALQEQIKALQTQQVQLQTTANATVSDIIEGLREGSEGDQVTLLQTLLSLDASIYPEKKITGYFGGLTRRALMRFQIRHGLEGVGFIGPRTRAELNKFLREKCKSDTYAWCRGKSKPSDDSDDADDDSDDALSISDISATPSQTGAVVKWKTDEDASGKVYYGTTNPLNLASAQSVTETYGWNWWWWNSSPTMKKDHTVSLTGLSASTTYYFVVESKDKKGHTATSSQQSFMTTSTAADTTPPSISSIVASNVGTSTATISWNTNENANSKVYYSTATPLATSTATAVSDGALLTSHSLSLTGLTPNTTHYVRIESTDASGNTTLSSESSFITSAVPVADTTAPVISAVSVSSASTTATVGWTTNEAATSKVFYGTATPLNTGTASNVSSSSFVTSHSLGLSGLSASTTYYMLVESKDAANNTATSSESSFTTGN